jgi:midasin
MTVLDGLISWPQLSSYTTEALHRLRNEAESYLHELVSLSGTDSREPTYDVTQYVQLGPFALPRGPLSSVIRDFNLWAPTSRDNAVRVCRASQVRKPILLEGSPGVGKTSLIAALANLSGHHLHRINLSDQTDLVDLFGSDLPVEGSGPGEFTWRDGGFLTALKEGHWVLLDEMNLASQTVLEGLNAVLDHRGSVYIPELGQSFIRHPSFRIFAAQNPLRQGGGRKGLPKSFVNRFTKVYVEELTSDDMLLVCQHLFPDYPAPMLRGMIEYNALLAREIVVNRRFARDGHPWEFNLRDVVRWASLLGSSPIRHPVHYLRSVYLCRFRSDNDRLQARKLFETVFPMVTDSLEEAPDVMLSPSFIRIGQFYAHRSTDVGQHSTAPIIPLQAQLGASETFGLALSNRSPILLQGPTDSGKTGLPRVMAGLLGGKLHELSLTSSADTTDILGSFEQVDKVGHSLILTTKTLAFVARHLRICAAVREDLLDKYIESKRILQQARSAIYTGLPDQIELLDSLSLHDKDDIRVREELKKRIQALSTVQEMGHFEWVDGPLVTALKEGHWLLLNGANLCNPSVLDRLNGLCEPGGVLSLSERGPVDGSTQTIAPHPGFRLIMSIDWSYGELSRAMRNRGTEISLTSNWTPEDRKKLAQVNRVPPSDSRSPFCKDAVVEFEAARRCLTAGIPMLSTTLDTIVPYDSRTLVWNGLSSLLSTRYVLESSRLEQLLYSLLICTPPAYTAVARRSLPCHLFGGTLPSVFGNILHAITRHQLPAILATFREKSASQWGIPVEVLSSQVSAGGVAPRQYFR